MLKKTILLSIIICTSFFVAACTPRVTTSGYMVDDQRLSQIKQGVSTKEDVLSALGTPSAAGTFDDQNWYYIGQIISKEAFFKPEVVDRRVIEIAFNDNIVSEVRELKKEDGVDVALVSRTTPTKGSDFTMLEQFFGNLGRFNSDAAKR